MLKVARSWGKQREYPARIMNRHTAKGGDTVYASVRIDEAHWLQLGVSDIRRIECSRWCSSLWVVGAHNVCLFLCNASRINSLPTTSMYVLFVSANVRKNMLDWCDKESDIA
jgi:hypothetical protein